MGSWWWAGEGEGEERCVGDVITGCLEGGVVERRLWVRGGGSVSVARDVLLGGLWRQVYEYILCFRCVLGSL